MPLPSPRTCSMPSTSLPCPSRPIIPLSPSTAPSPVVRRDYDIGQFARILESPSSVGDHILLASPGIEKYPHIMATCFQRIKSTEALHLERGTIRPCVVLDKCPDGEHPTVFLCGTFGGSSYEDLPYLYRHFASAIAPHSLPNGSSSVNTCPPWHCHNAVLLKFRIRSTRKLQGLWPRKDETKLEDGDVRGFYLSQEVLEMLRLEAANAFNSWVKLCNADPSFLPRVAAEYNVCVFPPSIRLLRSPSPISSATVVLDKGEEEEKVFGTYPVMLERRF